MTDALSAAATRLLALLSLCLLLMTCKSQEDMLPSATQTGQNTFGCLIDGKSYVPDGGNGFMPAKPVNGGFLVIYNAAGLGIYVSTYAKNKQRIELYLNDFRTGRYELNGNTQPIPVSVSPKDYGLYESSEGDDYVTSSKYTGSITITKADTLTHIVSGTFEFEAVSPTGKTVTVSNGRFDVNPTTQ